MGRVLRLAALGALATAAACTPAPKLKVAPFPAEVAQPAPVAPVPRPARAFISREDMFHNAAYKNATAAPRVFPGRQPDGSYLFVVSGAGSAAVYGTSFHTGGQLTN